MDTNILHVEGLTKKYGNKMVLEDISFDVQKGEFLTLLGPSGCGKTTLLKLIIGIENPDSGHIYKDEQDICGLEPGKRNMGIVFQNYALFPNMNVYNNIAYALKCRHLPKEEIKKKVDDIIHYVGLEEHAYKKPNQLSGGQQQRVAIARTIILEPDIILFDEPMSALDAEIKVTLRQLLKEIQAKSKITMIYVTHDQEEAFALSNRIMIIHDSHIDQLDTPHNVYHNPATEFVKKLVVDHLNRKMESIKNSIK